MPFETDNPAEELRAKALDMFPYNKKLAQDTYHWHAADEIDRLRNALVEIERLGWKEGLGAEHAIATHYQIRAVVHKALNQCPAPSNK